MGTWIIGGLLAIGFVVAGRYVIVKTKNGECPGGCSGCSHCCHAQTVHNDK